MAALTPLRAEGDPVARAWSDQLARRSGDAILEIAVLSEEARLGDGTVADPANVLLAYGEALSRAGDPAGAADAFRRAIVESPLGETAPAAALALFRLASGDRAAERGALGQALSALAQACAEEPAIAAAAAREAALSSLAAGVAVSPPASTEGDTPSARADAVLWQFLAGVRGQRRRGGGRGPVGNGDRPRGGVRIGDAGGAGALRAGSGAGPVGGTRNRRARRGGGVAADARARLWRPAVADLPVAAGSAWPAARPDPRRARARRIGGPLAIALHLEAAMDAERAGDLAGALAAYGSVIGADPQRLEAWSGVRRVARAGGDTLGEARALARLGALVRDPHRAAGLLVDAGAAYEQAGRADDAIAALARAVELDPDSTPAYEQAHRLLRSDLQAPGRAEILDGLLSYRLAAARLSRGERVALLFERGRHRLSVEGGLAGALEDFKQDLEVRAGKPGGAAGAGAGHHGRWRSGRCVGVARALPAGVGRRGGARDAGGRIRARPRRRSAARAWRWRPATRPAGTSRVRWRRCAAPPTFRRPIPARWTIWRRCCPPSETWRAPSRRCRRPPRACPTRPAQASRWIRIGEILRDRAADAAGSAAAFRQAADLAPLGPGVALLTGLYDAGQDARGALQIVEREIADLRQALAANPLDASRLARLAEWLVEARRRGGQAGGDGAVASVHALATGAAAPASESAAPAAPQQARALLAALADPDAGGFAAEIWPHLAEVAEALFPPPPVSRWWPPPRRAWRGCGRSRRLWRSRGSICSRGRRPVRRARRSTARRRRCWST